MITFLKQYYGDCIGPLDFPMKDEDARELERELDSGELSAINFKRSDALESFLPNERGDISILSDSSPDKQGEITDPASVDFTVFRKNPVVTFNHNYDLPPVGRSIWQKLVAGGIWKAKTIYPNRPGDYLEKSWLPDSVWKLVKSGSLNGKSLGGVASWREPTVEDESKFGFKKGEVRRITKAVKVYEYACCPIAINNNSIVEMISKAEIDLPPEVLARDFPEVYVLLQKSFETINKLPELSSEDIISADRYISDQKSELLLKAQKLQKEIPSRIQDSLRRLCGKVN